MQKYKSCPKCNHGSICSANANTMEVRCSHCKQWYTFEYSVGFATAKELKQGIYKLLGF